MKYSVCKNDNLCGIEEGSPFNQVWIIFLLFISRGVTAMGLCFLLFGVTQTPDGPFRRPHPGMSHVMSRPPAYEALNWLCFNS